MQKVDTERGIEDILYEKKLITSDQLSALKFEHVNTGKPVFQILRERNYISSEDFAKAYGDAFNIPFVTLVGKQIDPKLLDYFPQSVAKKYGILPFEQNDNILSVAMLDPLDLQAVEFMERRTGLRVRPYVATEKDLMLTVEEQYSRTIGEHVSAALEEVTQETLKIDEKIKDIGEGDEVLKDAPVSRIVGRILEYAVKLKASDVHIEPTEEKTRVRYRVDGILQEKITLPKKVHDSIVARIKVLSMLKIDEKRIPQDGRFKIQVGNTKTDLRVSTLPTLLGEKVVIRLLKEEGITFTFKDLGLRGNALRSFENGLLKPNGIILVTGPTGSGKTVTLATSLSKLNTIRVNIITLEDPVEIRVPGVNQVQVNPQAGLTFASGLRSILRQDPNIIMVGEIRDGETASLAIQSALTGHLVLATLHTNSSAASIARLLDMGVETFLLASTVNAILAQRLVRRLCPSCRSLYEASEELVKDMKRVLGPLMDRHLIVSTKEEGEELIEDDIKKIKKDKISLYKPNGCDKCNAGYTGRIGIYEVLTMNEKVSRMVLEHKPSSEIETQAVSDGMLTLIQDGYLKVLEGVTTIEEVLRVAKD
ncbi:MAG: ATPase, T2SS/T4P/T4SS family [Patescibacteria group bacterium]